MKKYLSLLVIVFLMSLLFGCANKNDNSLAPNDRKQQDSANGSITLVGSDSMQDVVGALAEAFEAENSYARIQVQGGGSGASFQPVRQGIAQLGLVSRKLKDDEKDLKTIEIAYDGIVVVVNKNNPVDSLSKEQIAKIYSGEIVNWKDVGGNDSKITVISREAGSGTTGTFEDIVMNKKEISPTVLRINQSEGIRATVAKSEEAIGFFSLYLADESIKKLKVDEVEASEANVKNGTYTLSRTFNYTYKDQLVDLAKEFVDFTLSEEGQKIVSEEGLISIK